MKFSVVRASVRRATHTHILSKHFVCVCVCAPERVYQIGVQCFVTDKRKTATSTHPVWYRCHARQWSTSYRVGVHSFIVIVHLEHHFSFLMGIVWQSDCYACVLFIKRMGCLMLHPKCFIRWRTCTKYTHIICLVDVSKRKSHVYSMASTEMNVWRKRKTQRHTQHKNINKINTAHGKRVSDTYENETKFQPKRIAFRFHSMK